MPLSHQRAIVSPLPHHCAGGRDQPTGTPSSWQSGPLAVLPIERRNRGLVMRSWGVEA